MAPFFRNRMASERRRDAAFDLTTRARGILSVNDDAVVSVSEHDCGDPECRGARTVILVMRPDQPTQAAANLSNALGLSVSVSNAPKVQ